VDALLDAVLDERLLRMGICPEHVETRFGRERVVPLGGVPCRLLATTAATLAPILDELVRAGRAFASATFVLDGRPLRSVVHGPRASAPPAAMHRLVQRLWDRAAIVALREAAHA
jgi:hypothetical protein